MTWYEIPFGPLVSLMNFTVMLRLLYMVVRRVSDPMTLLRLGLIRGRRRNRRVNLPRCRIAWIITVLRSLRYRLNDLYISRVRLSISWYWF